MNGRETVRYYNRSPDTLRVPRFFLNQNLFKPGAARTQEVPVTSGMEILRVAAAGQTSSKADSGVGYWIEGNVMGVHLPRPLAPHDSVDIDVAWAFQVPPDGAPREGTTGDVFMVAYWYPQLAVYDDVSGWVNDPYLGTAEFYMGYADYDVTICAPQGWLVASTGELTNPNEVLSKQTRDRLAEARRSGASCTSCATGSRRRSDQGDEHRLRRRTVVAVSARATFATSTGARRRSILWDATIAVVGDRDGDRRPDTTTINTFYRPEARANGRGTGRRRTSDRRRVPVELSVAVSVAADDGARGAGVVQRVWSIRC